MRFIYAYQFREHNGLIVLTQYFEFLSLVSIIRTKCINPHLGIRCIKILDKKTS